MITLKGKYARLSDAVMKKSAFSENRDRTLTYLNLVDCDRMLYNFRKTFGLENKCEPLGGWEDPKGLLRGHSTGHFLSALALAYSATGEAVYKEKMDYMVSELRKMQLMCKGKASQFVCKGDSEHPEEELWSTNPSEWGEGFLSAYSPDQFALLEKFTKYNKIWAPYYTLHKIVAGLLDCYTRGGNEEALDCAKGIALWIADRLAPLTDEHRTKMWSMYIAGEFGGMNESLTALYNITGEEKYLVTAKMFDNENIFPGLSEGKDTVQNLHANQHIPQILGAIEEYMATEDDFYYNIGKNFFDIVTDHHMYAIGGVGQGESFRDPDALAQNIKEATNCETCAAYNLLKTARMLYGLNPDEVKYMDYYERAMINQILASQTPFITENVHNGVTYMLPIGPGAEKEYTDDYDSFTCCHGTGMENHVKYTDASFFMKDDNTLMVNQYVPATYKGDIEVDVDTLFPFGGGKITVTGNCDMTVMFRIPTWSQNPFKDLKTEGRYAVLNHKAGETDVIEVNFTYEVRFEKTSDKLEGKEIGAVMYGPFVMVCENSYKKFLTIGKDLTPVEGEVALTGYGLKFVPMYKMHGKPYHTYFIIEE
ncbi:MAG: glycoside hydrolase family 127 protein [Clostridia bacterium]|nr:glycoside hydrolase family 127 protein [Clostridia bacterium]